MSTIKIRRYNQGPATVEAEVVGGLAITPALKGDQAQFGAQWTITHAASGHHIGFFADLAAAEAARDKLLALPIDWTAPSRRIATAENRRLVEQTIGRS